MEEKYPEHIDKVIFEILKENNLLELHQKEIFKMIRERDSEKRKKIFQNLPGVKLAKIIRGVFLREIKLENLDFYIKEALHVPEERSKKIGQRLIELIFSQEKMLTSFSEKKEATHDIYREPIK